MYGHCAHECMTRSEFCNGGVHDAQAICLGMSNEPGLLKLCETSQ